MMTMMYDVAHGGAGGTRRADRFSQKEQNSSVRQHPVRCNRLGTALESQTDSVKKNRIRLSVVNPTAVAGSKRRSCSTARQIQSKRTEFVCPSTTRPLSLAQNDARRPDRFSQKEQNSSVRRQPGRCRLPVLARNGARQRRTGNLLKRYRIICLTSFKPRVRFGRIDNQRTGNTLTWYRIL
jgi:hypothetical protein